MRMHTLVLEVVQMLRGRACTWPAWALSLLLCKLWWWMLGLPKLGLGLAGTDSAAAGRTAGWADCGWAGVVGVGVGNNDLGDGAG